MHSFVDGRKASGAHHLPEGELVERHFGALKVNHLEVGHYIGERYFLGAPGAAYRALALAE